MKCPHCGYTHGTVWVPRSENEVDGPEDLVTVQGSSGSFYKQYEILLKREEQYDSHQEKYLYACPSCTKTFIN